MQTLTSKDGTKIAFDKVGSGPAVILVNGAIAYRAFDPSMAQLAELLGTHFTVYNYDRRGRGDSGDTQPFAKEREIEDLQALVEDAGGKAMVFGISSGGVVSLDAAAVTPGVTKVVVYEPALIVDDSRQPVPADYTQHLARLSAEGKRAETTDRWPGRQRPDLDRASPLPILADRSHPSAPPADRPLKGPAPGGLHWECAH